MTTDTLPEVGVDPPTHAPRRWRWVVLILVVLLVVAGVAARGWWPGRAADVRSGTTLVTTEGMAARYGINISLIAVTAAGGLVEFRYQVVDPDKADPIIHDVALLPKLVVEDTGATLSLSTPPHNHGVNLQLGGTYFFLLANANGAVDEGSMVTVVIGDARLEHIQVQG